MVQRSSPTLRNRELGALLKRYREARNLTAVQVAAEVGLAPAVISRLENAVRTPRQANVRALCSYYGLDAQTTERLVQMAKESSKPGWWQRYDLESPTATYLDLESAAVSIEGFEATVVPGLLQTEEYAKEVIRPSRPAFSPEQLSETVESRIRRQQILSGDSPVRFHAVIDEAVLHRVIGSRDVMRDQLRQLMQLLELPHVELQVLPFAAGANPGLDGTFSVLSMPEDLMPAVVYVEGQLGQFFEDDPEEIKRIRHAFSGLVTLALDRQRSRGLIEERIRALT